MAFDPIRNYTELLATQGVFALVVIFIFIVERRAVNDVTNAKSDELRQHYLKSHRSAVLVRNVLLVPAVVIWAYALLFPHDPLKPITMRYLSGPAYEVEIGPSADDLTFYSRQYKEGQITWELHPRPREPRWLFTAIQKPQVELQDPSAHSTEPSHKEVPAPVQLDKKSSSPAGQVHVSPHPSLPPREVMIDASPEGPRDYEYRLDVPDDPTKMGHLYAIQNDQRLRLLWEEEKEGEGRKHVAEGRQFLEFFPRALAQTSLCQGNGMPKDEKTLLDDLGSRTLTVRLAARRDLVAAGASCQAFLLYAVQNANSSLYRDAGNIVESLTEIVRQLKSVALPLELYAELGKQNYDEANYAGALQVWQHLDDAFLATHASYLFYIGYANFSERRYKDAVAFFERFEKGDSVTIGRNASARSVFGEAYYQVGFELQRTGQAALACTELRHAVSQFDMAIELDPSLAEKAKNAGFYRKVANDRIRDLKCE